MEIHFGLKIWGVDASMPMTLTTRALFEYYNSVSIIDKCSPLLLLLKTNSQVVRELEQLESSLGRNLDRKFLTPLNENINLFAEEPIRFAGQVHAMLSLYNSYFRLGRKYLHDLANDFMELRAYGSLLHVILFLRFT